MNYFFKVALKWTILVSIYVALISCSSYVNRPMSSSITNLTTESASTSTKILNYSELISIAGLLPVPDVGVLYHQPEQSFWDWILDREIGATYSIGIARNPAAIGRKSFRIIGEMSVIPRQKQVIDAISAIDKLSQASALAASNLLKQSVVNLLLAQAVIEQVRLKNISDDNELENKKKLIEIERKIHSLNSDVRDANQNVNQDVVKVNLLEEQAQLATSIPGLIVVQWSTQKTGNGSVGAENVLSGEDSDIGNSLNFQSSNSKGQRGLAVLGGLKISSLFLAKDYMNMLATAKDDTYKRLLKVVGVTTSVMQTKYVSYSSNIDIANSINVQAQIQASSLYGLSSQDLLMGLDTAKLSGYLSNVSNLSNKGHINGMEWFRDDIDFKKCRDSLTCEFTSMPSYRSKSLREGCNPRDSGCGSQYDGWITLQSVNARLDADVLDALLSEYAQQKINNQKNKYFMH